MLGESASFGENVSAAIERFPKLNNWSIGRGMSNHVNQTDQFENRSRRTPVSHRSSSSSTWIDKSSTVLRRTRAASRGTSEDIGCGASNNPWLQLPRSF